jgi:uncharacterized protein YbaR (Trm112 family)
MPGSDVRCPTCNHPLVYFDGESKWTCINPKCAETHPSPS